MGETPRVEGKYANYFEIGHNEFEFLLDFGQQYDGDERPTLNSRVVTSPTYAKELLATLHRAVAEYEQEFGVIGKGE